MAWHGASRGFAFITARRRSPSVNMPQRLYPAEHMANAPIPAASKREMASEIVTSAEMTKFAICSLVTVLGMGYRAPGQCLVTTISTRIWTVRKKIESDQEFELRLVPFKMRGVSRTLRNLGTRG